MILAKGNNDGIFALKNNASILESKVMNSSNLSSSDIMFPEKNISHEHVILPADLFKNSTDSPIRVSIPVSYFNHTETLLTNEHSLVIFINKYYNFSVQVTIATVPGVYGNFSGVISLVLTRLVSVINSTNSSTYLPIPSPNDYNSTDMIEVIKQLDNNVSIILWELIFRLFLVK